MEENEVKAPSTTMAEYVQQIEYLKVSLDDMDDMLSSKPIKEWAYIVHDKDEYTDADLKAYKKTHEGDPEWKVGDKKAAHVHVIMKMNSPRTFEDIAKWFEDDPNRIQRSKDAESAKYGETKNAWNNMNSYLTHRTKRARRDKKHLYEVDEVVANYDYAAKIQEIEAELEERKTIDGILERICKGEIKEYELYQNDKILTDKQILENYGDIKKALEIAAKKDRLNGARNMSVVFVTGLSGTGKTTLAKWFAKYKLKKPYFVTGQSNDPFQNYMGQPVVILDEVRGSDFRLTEFLKMTDNNTGTDAKSRYYNKVLSSIETMIITSSRTIDDLYATAADSEGEEIKQIKRRLSQQWYVDENRIYISKYNDKFNKYDSVAVIDNPVFETVKKLKELKKKQELNSELIDAVKDWNPNEHDDLMTL